MMSKRSRLDALRRQINVNLALGSLVDLDLAVVDNDGRRIVLVALEDELLTVVLARLRAAGGFANLFVGGDDGRLRMVAVMDAACAISRPTDDMTAVGEEPGPLATVGTFLDWVALHPNGVKIASSVGHDALAKSPQRVELTAV